MHSASTHFYSSLVVFVSLISTLTLCAAEPGSLRGRIVDPTGAKLPYVRVGVVDMDGVGVAALVTTDRDGRFILDRIPEGTHYLWWRWSGPEKFGNSRKVVVGGGKATDLGDIPSGFHAADGALRVGDSGTPDPEHFEGHISIPLSCGVSLLSGQSVCDQGMVGADLVFRRAKDNKVRLESANGASMSEGPMVVTEHGRWDDFRVTTGNGWEFHVLFVDPPSPNATQLRLWRVNRKYDLLVP